MELIEYAKKYRESGFRVFPTEGKVPFANFLWKTQNAKNEDFLKSKNIAIAMGSGSGLLCIDFDTYKYKDGQAIIDDFIKNELVQFLHSEKRIFVEQTQSGGFHFIVKTTKEFGNKKIAKVKTENGKYECVIETRGDGGYIVAHPSENYKKISNFELWEIDLLADEEIDALFDILKSYNQEVVEASIPFVNNSIYEGKKVWEYYNEEQSSIDYAKQLLIQIGWKINGKHCTRPGKDQGTSATFGFIENNVFYVFSSSCHPFDNEKAYKPFNILTLLEFNGDYKASTKFLHSIYGNKKEAVQYESKEQQINVLQDCFIDFRKEVVLLDPLISVINDYSTSLEKRIGICTIGDISVLTGMQKAKKSFFLNKVIQSYLNPEKVIDEHLVGHSKVGKRKICVVDTEQSEYYANKNAKRINRISNSENFDYLSLRKFSPNERKERIELYLKNYNVDLGILIIDGIVDLCNNSNDMQEAIELTNWLMNISATMQIHIICVLHLNPGLNTNGETKMRGFLGTILAQKAETVLEIEKDKSNQKQSTIKPKDVRGELFKPFAIEINEVGIPILCSIGMSAEDGYYNKKNNEDNPFKIV